MPRLALTLSLAALSCAVQPNGSCDPARFEPVDITVSGGDAAPRSLVTSSCVLVTSVETGSVCEAEPRECTPVRDGERVRLWFPRDGMCGADGVVRPTTSKPDHGFGLVYSDEACP